MNMIQNPTKQKTIKIQNTKKHNAELEHNAQTSKIFFPCVHYFTTWFHAEENTSWLATSWAPATTMTEL